MPMLLARRDEIACQATALPDDGLRHYWRYLNLFDAHQRQLARAWICVAIPTRQPSLVNSSRRSQVTR